MKWKCTYLYVGGLRTSGTTFDECEFELVGGAMQQLVVYRKNTSIITLCYPQLRRADSDTLEFVGVTSGDGEAYYMQRLYFTPEAT